ncbi:MAG TPA: hypothetical protein VE685_09135 [Thermoanaerobaculia bacterium]|nr:hypothetical protein [Thermoanaerobaculia bacterium]
MTRPSPRSHLALQPPDQTPARSVDRRSLLSGLSALTLLAAPASVLRALETEVPTQPLPACTPPSGMPAHLKSLCASDPNSFAVNAWGTAEAYGAGGTNGLLDRLEEFLAAHKAELSTSPFVLNLAALERAGNLPRTIEGLTQVMVNSTLCSAGDFGSLCIEGPLGQSCIDTGCEDIPGDCWLTPEPLREFIETCECVRRVRWWEVALIALLLLLLIATPGPDEIPAMIAAASRLIVRVAPAIP